MRRHTVLVALVGAVSVLAQANDSIEILQTGIFHGEEVTAEAGGVWWAMFPVDDGFELQQARIDIETVRDEMLDDDNEMTGKSITIDDDREPVLLIKGLQPPKTGRLYSTFGGEQHKFLYPGEQLYLQNETTLAAYGTATEPGSDGTTPRIADYTLMIHSGIGPDRRTQELASFDALDPDSQPALIWAGDLDGDGKLDLLMNLTWHYNVSVLTLFLSTAAGEGELVGKAAEWITTGC